MLTHLLQGLREGVRVRCFYYEDGAKSAATDAGTVTNTYPTKARPPPPATCLASASPGRNQAAFFLVESQEAVQSVGEEVVGGQDELTELEQSQDTWLSRCSARQVRTVSLLAVLVQKYK